MRVKTVEQRNEFISAAGHLFIQQGYADVTMEAIAATAGKSKVTLYNYFSSKEELFEAFVVQAGAGAVEKLTKVYAEEDNAQDILQRLGVALLHLVSRPDVIALDRLIIGEAKRYPELARIFFENGPKRTVAALAEVMAHCMENGKIAVRDAELAALHFKGICASDLIENLMWGTVNPPTKRELEKISKDAVKIFLNGYAASSPS
ncbi:MULTISPECIES: TetR/AcrR family transcriptional regulator [unclassified Herbaspirillum]|uniref:TetR/AcrR family transcriptional regulator n=1 Tax=unclassified Herbaspirillum TaxID=2624150 RepID=UPI00114FD23F|nr:MULTISPECIES: TetR/AcrR family transcriptional regulator [unclassified Herbaspirillum]MBB5391257.1 AcrR family transcriptional regulator [Herbaspirillum sp. SJZ102]TQK13055.1 TetR family transcriptional regulator [Herbaspirillum sp. SJZ130]TQK15059.1 TetR family transcriptional regulator [Herbaspirillum sp. SJZ106]